MTATISWVHVGEPHMDEADSWLARDRLCAIVAAVDRHIADDFEDGTLAPNLAAFPEVERSEVKVIARHRCIVLDIVSAGAGGPDFRLTMHHRNRLAEHGIDGAQLGANRTGGRW